MSRSRVLIVDDEPLARRRLTLMLAEMPEAQVVGEAGDMAAALDRIVALKPDIVLLDIQMPGRSGFDLAGRLTGPDAPIIIFVTAFQNHALGAWEHDAAAYLLKPVAFDRLRAALERAGRRRRQRGAEGQAEELAQLVEALRQNADPARPRYEPEFWVRRHGGIACVRTDRILRVEAERDYVRLHAADQSYLLRETIGGMEKRLDPARFVRVHRSAIVRRDDIAEIRQVDYGAIRLRLTDGSEQPVGRSYAAAVRALGRGG